MPGYIEHPINHNLRLKIEIDEYPSKPYNDGGFPIWRIEPSRGAYAAVQETDITSYVTPARLDDALSQLNDEHDLDGPFVLRYLRIFWGVTFVEMWHSGSYWYLTCDPADWREKVGVDDAVTQREDYTKGAFTEWKAWCEGEVYMATEQQRVQREVRTHTIYPDGDTDDDFRSYEEWEDTENGGVGGFYGDVDDDMQKVMGWQFGWPEAACKHCGEGITKDVTHGWVDADVPFDQRERYTHCVTGVMMHTRGPKHEPKEK